MQDDPATRPLVSVVVPVFEPGDAIEPCIASLLAQSLPPDQLELIFVDDGSRDATGARLDALASEHPQVRVAREPGSGWAGRPRNVGIDLAAGRYVQFVDQDDRLAPEALERCSAMAEAHGTDMVIGKVTSDFRGVPHGLFTKDRGPETVWTAPLIDSLTPHKLFRRSFLLDHGIRFPEGRRRLEDQLFMVRAYFAGATASILATYPCYFYLERRDGSNAGSATIEPAGYYANLREVIDVVLAGTEPGPDRDRFLARFLRVELLGRLERDILRGDDPYREALVTEVATTIATRMTEGAIATLAPLQRARLDLVREHAIDRLVALSSVTLGWQGRTTARSSRLHRGRFQLGVEAGMVTREGDPVTAVETAFGGRALDPARTAGILPAPVDVAAALERPRLQVYLQSLDDGVLWRAAERDVRPSPQHPDRLLVRARVIIDPRSAAAESALPAGRWRLRARLTIAGIDQWSTVSAGGAATMVASTVDQRIDRLTAAEDQVRIETDAGTWASAVAASTVDRRRSGGRELVARLPVGAPPTATTRWVPVRFEPAGGGRPSHRRGRLEPRGGRWAVAVAVGPVRGRLRPGGWLAAAGLDGASGPWSELGPVTVDTSGRVSWSDGGRVGVRQSLAYHTRRQARTLGRIVLRGPLRRLRPTAAALAGGGRATARR